MPADLKKIQLFADFTQEELEKVRNIVRKEKISQPWFPWF